MMKSKTLLLILLFLPYLIWLSAIPFISLPFDSILHTLAAGFSIIYGIGIIFWGIPYTTLVLGILIWSKNKSTKELYAVLSRSPLILALITVIELFIVYIYLILTSEIRFSPLEDLGNLIVYSLSALFIILSYGYVFVFLNKSIYKVFEQRNWIIEEHNSQSHQD